MCIGSKVLWVQLFDFSAARSRKNKFKKKNNKNIKKRF